MKKRIFWSILLSCFLTLLITAAFVTSVLYVNSWEEYKHEIEIEALYVGEAVNVMDTANGAAARYLEEVGRSTKNRITLIAADGSVLFDSYADEDDLDNHLSAPKSPTRYRRAADRPNACPIPSARAAITARCGWTTAVCSASAARRKACWGSSATRWCGSWSFRLSCFSSPFWPRAC